MVVGWWWGGRGSGVGGEVVVIEACGGAAEGTPGNTWLGTGAWNTHCLAELAELS